MVEITVRVTSDDPYFARIAKAIQPLSSPTQPQTAPASNGGSGDGEEPPKIKLFRLIKENDEKAKYPEETQKFNKIAFPNPRSGSAVYKASAQYFLWDKATETYTMLEKAKKELEEYDLKKKA